VGGLSGQAPNSFDALTPVLRWVEEGVVPEGIVATDAETGRTRPVYPCPQAARHDGIGSIDDAASFHAVTRQQVPDDSVSWLGSFESDRDLWWDGIQLTGRRPPDQ
jgi:hypothetical protein